MPKTKQLTVKILLLLIFIDGLETFVHFCFKKTAIPQTGFEIQSFNDAFLFIKAVASSPYLWTGLCVVMVIFTLWSTILSRIDLSVAVPVASFSYIAVPIVSIIFFNEKVSALRWCGIACIIFGVILVSLSSKAKEGVIS